MPPTNSTRVVLKFSCLHSGPLPTRPPLRPSTISAWRRICPSSSPSHPPPIVRQYIKYLVLQSPSLVSFNNRQDMALDVPQIHLPLLQIVQDGVAQLRLPEPRPKKRTVRRLFHRSSLVKTVYTPSNQGTDPEPWPPFWRCRRWRQ